MLLPVVTGGVAPAAGKPRAFGPDNAREARRRQAADAAAEVVERRPQRGPAAPALAAIAD